MPRQRLRGLARAHRVLDPRAVKSFPTPMPQEKAKPRDRIPEVAAPDDCSHAPAQGLGQLLATESRRGTFGIENPSKHICIQNSNLPSSDCGKDLKWPRNASLKNVLARCPSNATPLISQDTDASSFPTMHSISQLPFLLAVWSPFCGQRFMGIAAMLWHSFAGPAGSSMRLAFNVFVASSGRSWLGMNAPSSLSGHQVPPTTPPS